VENARDLSKKTSLPLSIGHYLNNMALLTNQWNSNNFKDPDRQRIYLKDIDCPPLWHDKLSQLVPPFLYYLNESTGDLGGAGSVEEPNPNGPGTRRGRGIAQAGDLMSSLPPEMRAENMMCYIGHEGTYTPSHREMCASLGHNIMVETSTGSIEDGKTTKPGSSIWFMTETKDRHVVSEYWLSALGHDIEVENHFAQINAWKAAPFKTYVVEQRVGDFILIPPLAPHQVWNRGTRTMKAAWNRTTVETLEMALEEALPRARMVCRDEQYKNKAIIYYTLTKYSRLLAAAANLKTKNSNRPPAKVRQLQKDFRRLHTLYNQIIVSESFASGQEERKVEFIPYDSNVTCSYCRGNIFNRFLTCPSCVGELPGGDEDTYDICMECYAMGRSCHCISKLKWVEQFSWGDLTQKHEQWRRQIIHFEGQVTEKSPKSLKVELERHGKRTLAEICQMELKKRPWHDVKKPAPAVNQGEESEEVEVNGEGIVKKKKRKPRLSEKYKREHKVCHFHTTWEPKWKQVECTKCDASFCFGTLARAFDMKPQDILADKNWKCPRCRKFCICRRCREKPGWKKIEPPRIMLGHDTKKVADPRSVESLVDYSHSNISWLQKVGDDGMKDTRRLQKKKKDADKAKAKKPELGDHYVEDTNMPDAGNHEVEDGILRLAHHEGIPIDPALGGGEATNGGDFQDEEVHFNENPEEADLGNEYETYQHGPPQPQHVIPAGGIIRDAEHAYDATEAITFDYPDPEFGMQAPTEEQEAPREQPAPGYEAAVLPDEPAEIEMVSRKRKRSGVAPEDEAYKSHKRIKDISVKKKKPRKSLVVKLNVGKSRLAELNKMAIIAQRALNGVVDDETPVIGSDLRALNAESGAANAQLPVKKVRVEREDEDDEFTGPRVRKDRQKSTPEAHTVPARRTRTQTVAYDEPSDGEDSMEITSNHSGRSGRRQSQLRPAAGEDHSQSSSSTRADSNGTEESSLIEMVLDPLLDQAAGAAESKRDDQAVALARDDGITSFAAITKSHMPARQSPAIAVTDGINELARARNISAQQLSAPAARNTPTAKTQPKAKPEKRTSKITEVEKNRKAKLAAMHWAEGESDDFEEETWSASDEEDETFVPEGPNTQVDGAASKSRMSLPNTTRPARHEAPAMTQKSASARKANASDWKSGDSSDDEVVITHVETTKQPGPKRLVSGLKPMASRRGKPRRSDLTM
jgi:JmjC domain, hydroxylase/Zinc-finger domain of monoamine-oxidase A repressor R1